MLNAPRHQDMDQRLRPTVSGHSLAVVCVLLYISPGATSLATSPPATVSVTLAWDASPSTNIAGYKIYYGTNSGSYTQVVSAGPATQRAIAGLTPGTSYFFAATACDDTGLESDYSNEIPFTAPAARPDVSLPELSLLRTGTNSILQWPTNYPGYTLQSSSSPAGGWTDLASSPSVSGSAYTYTHTASAAQQYYRLKQ
jgi:hypothetical protein